MNDLENIKLKLEKLQKLYESKTIPEYKKNEAYFEISKLNLKAWVEVITKSIKNGTSYKEFCNYNNNLAFVMEKCNSAYKILKK